MLYELDGYWDGGCKGQYCLVWCCRGRYEGFGSAAGLPVTKVWVLGAAAKAVRRRRVGRSRYQASRGPAACIIGRLKALAGGPQ